MSKQIKRIELSEPDVTRDIRSSIKHLESVAESTVTTLRMLNEQLKQTKGMAAGLKLDLNKGTVTDVAGMREQNRLTKEANNLLIQQERIKQAKIRTENLERQTSERLAKQQERSVRLKRQEASAYSKLSSEARRLKNESKDLGAELLRLERAGKFGTKQWKDMARQYDATTREARQLDAQLKRLDGSVGDNFRNVGNYSSAFKRLGASFRGVFAGLGAIAAGRFAFNTIEEFDEKLADISKTANITIEQSRKLSKELLNIDTRTSVTGLQELASAGGRLGLALRDIPGFVQSADKAFVALGDDLDGTAEEIATNLGKVASTFGDEQEFGIDVAIQKTGSALNELSANSKAAAGPILDFTNRLAGVSAQANISQADVQALGAFFDESGQSVEVASTTLNTLLPDLAANYEKFAKVAGLPAEQFKELAANSPIEALKAVAVGARSSEKGLVGLTQTLESYGVESARAASIVGLLSSKTDRLTELQGISNKAFEEGTSLQTEFEKKNQTVGAQLEKLTKAFKAEILGIDGATGASSALSATFGFLARNMGTIIKTLGFAVKGFIAYKIAMIAINVQHRIADRGLKGLITGFKNSGKAADDAGKSAGGFGSTLKGIGWAVAIELAYELGAAIYDVASGAAQARENLARMDKQAEISLKRAGAVVTGIQDRLNERLRQIDLRISSGDIKDESKILELRREAYELSQDEYREKIKLANERKARYKDLIKEAEIQREIINNPNRYESFARTTAVEELKKIQKELNITGDKAFGFLENNSSGADIVAQLKANVNGVNVALKEYYAGLKSSTEETEMATAEITGNSRSVDENTKKRKELNTELEKTNDFLSRQRELWQEIDELDRSLEIEKIQDNIDEVFANEMKRVTETGQLDVDELERIIDEKYKLESQFIKERQALELESIRMKYKAESDAERAALEERRAKLLSQEGLTGDQRADIERQYAADLEIIRKNDITRQSDFELEREKLQKESNSKQRDLLDQRNDEINQKNDELIDAQIEANTKEVDAEDDKNASLSDIYSKRNELIDVFTAYFIKQTDKRIEAIDREIDKRRQQIDIYAGLAESGNIQAQQSLALEQEAIDKAMRERERMEQRKQRIELVSTALQTYNSKLGEGKTDAQAFGETVTSIEALRAFVNALPAFFDGVEDTGPGGRGIDSKGGFLSVLHPHERVVDAENNQALAGYSNEALAALAMNDRMNRFNENAKQSYGWDALSALSEIQKVNKNVEALTKVMREKPDTDIQVERITQGAMTIARRTIKGNQTTTNIKVIR